MGPPDPSVLKSKETGAKDSAGVFGLNDEREGVAIVLSGQTEGEGSVRQGWTDRQRAAVSAPAAISGGSSRSCGPCEERGTRLEVRGGRSGNQRKIQRGKRVPRGSRATTGLVPHRAQAAAEAALLTGPLHRRGN